MREDIDKGRFTEAEKEAIRSSQVKQNGKDVNTLKAGTYSIKIEDKSASHDFHLIGPGASVKTGVAFKGTKTWALTLRKGLYRFRSDTHPKLKGSFRVT